jgi:cold shock CspA family protein
MNLPVPAVAWYGAVVSTLGVALALYVALRDRPRLKISIQANMRAFGATSYDPNKLYVVVSVANTGRRTVTVGLVGFTQRPRGSGDIFLHDSTREGPKEISEGKSVTYSANQEGLPIAKLHHVIVRDQAGRVWKRRVPRALRRGPRLADLADKPASR